MFINSSVRSNRRCFDSNANAIFKVQKNTSEDENSLLDSVFNGFNNFIPFLSVLSSRHLSKSWTFALMSLVGEKTSFVKTLNPQLTTPICFALRIASPKKTSWSKSFNWLWSLLFCFIFPRWNRICFHKWTAFIVKAINLRNEIQQSNSNRVILRVELGTLDLIDSYRWLFFGVFLEIMNFPSSTSRVLVFVSWPTFSSTIKVFLFVHIKPVPANLVMTRVGDESYGKSFCMTPWFLFVWISPFFTWEVKVVLSKLGFRRLIEKLGWRVQITRQKI